MIELFYIMIKHIWFDFAGTLFKHTPEYEKVHNELRYKTYAEIVDKEVSQELIDEFEGLYKKHKSNSQTFISLGKHPNFWGSIQKQADKAKYIQNSVDYQALFQRLRQRGVKISLFTNALGKEVLRVLPHLGLASEDFDHLLTGEAVKKKPSLDGYYQVIKLSAVEPSQTLYVGDRIEAEILPAKKAGLKTALVWTKEKDTPADYELESIKGVLNCLK